MSGRGFVHRDAAAGARALAVLRIGTAAVLVAQACATARDLPVFVGRLGIVQSPVRDQLAHWSLPRLAWLDGPARAVGLSEGDLIYAVLGVYLLSLMLMGLGWRVRLAAPVAWLAHLTLKVSGAASAYGAYEFGTIALAYCALLPTTRALALDRSTAAVGGPDLPVLLGRWLLRGHLAIVYVSSGVAKVSGEQWRNGEAIWRALMRPDAALADPTWLAAVPWLAAAATWSVVVLEIGYGAAVLWPRAHRYLLAAVCTLHLGIALALDLWFFSGLMIVLNLAALAPRVPGGLPRRVVGRLGGHGSRSAATSAEAARAPGG